MTSEPAINTKLRNQIRTACEEFHLVEPGDRILIGLSGGKDSLTLTHFLSELMREKNFAFKVVAAHIKFKNLPYGIDAQYLQDFCESRQVEYHLVEDNIREVYLENDHKETCIHCSRFRRAKLMELARVFSCNKLTLGHHLDDIVATLIMNMTHHGRFSSMAVKLDITAGEEKYNMTMIRPLAYTPELDIKQFCAENEFQPAKCRCPWGDTGIRSQTRAAVDDIVSKLGEEARLNIFRSQFHIIKKTAPEHVDPHEHKHHGKNNSAPNTDIEDIGK